MELTPNVDVILRASALPQAAGQTVIRHQARRPPSLSCRPDLNEPASAATVLADTTRLVGLAPVAGGDARFVALLNDRRVAHVDWLLST